MTDDVLEREWNAALAAEVGGDLLHADLGRRLVQLAAEMDRRILAGHRNLLRPARVPAARCAAVPTALADATWLSSYIVRTATASARGAAGEVGVALAESRRAAAVEQEAVPSGLAGRLTAAATPVRGAATGS